MVCGTRPWIEETTHQHICRVFDIYLSAITITPANAESTTFEGTCMCVLNDSVIKKKLHVTKRV